MKKRTEADLWQRGTQATKKFVVSVLIVGVFVIYSVLHARSNLAASGPTDPGAAAGATTPTATGAAQGAPTAVPGSLYKDGTFTGSVADAQWGYVQVRAVIQRGRITDVRFVQYPNDRSRSVYINSWADPQLTSEAIQAQSAQVDIVTGATDTSVAFMQSLADALSQAQA
jgi:uncharacterized protein with FMN-binding domain